MDSITTEHKAKIKWACRRGMLELDVVIMPFFETCFDSLTSQEKKDFVDFLQCDDPDLFSWLMGHGRSKDDHIAAITDKIIEHNRSKLR